MLCVNNIIFVQFTSRQHLNLDVMVCLRKMTPIKPSIFVEDARQYGDDVGGRTATELVKIERETKKKKLKVSASVRTL